MSLRIVNDITANSKTILSMTLNNLLEFCNLIYNENKLIGNPCSYVSFTLEFFIVGVNELILFEMIKYT